MYQMYRDNHPHQACLFHRHTRHHLGLTIVVGFAEMHLQDQQIRHRHCQGNLVKLDSPSYLLELDKCRRLSNQFRCYLQNHRHQNPTTVLGQT